MLSVTYYRADPGRARKARKNNQCTESRCYLCKTVPSIVGMNAGTRIAELRKSLGITQRALAQALDVDVSKVSRIECGVHRLSLDDANAICAFLGVPLKLINEGGE